MSSILERVTIPEIERKFMMFPARFSQAQIAALNDQEFAQFYLESMTEYQEKDGWWGNAGIPSCTKCKAPIPGPAQMRRYYGNSLHDTCFRELWKTERIRLGRTVGNPDRGYWDRVAKLDLSTR